MHVPLPIAAKPFPESGAGVPTADAVDPVALAAALQATVDTLQCEVASLQVEIELLRRRDNALNRYMQQTDEEMRLAARLQRDFLPKQLPQIGQVRFHTLFRPAGYVSGDLYDIMRLDEHHVGFYMADAVGHGLPAALLTMFIKNALVTKQIGPEGYRLLEPSQTMARLNDALISANLSYATFATAIYGWVDARSHSVCFCRGGHPNPVVVRADGRIEHTHSDGPLLGIFPDEVFTDCRVPLEPGDKLLVYSDGVEVAFCETEHVDPTQWLRELESCRNCPAERLIQEFADRIDRNGGSLAPKDDLTVIAIEIG
jgi:serine phosphatase RsbU (regulator of sigma subunit)